MDARTPLQVVESKAVFGVGSMGSDLFIYNVCEIKKKGLFYALWTRFCIRDLKRGWTPGPGPLFRGAAQAFGGGAALAPRPIRQTP